ncbi:hypothetical protein P153DRAFT_359096 [Dothidotthia symphoricarpi CBS 119687]|uniref:Uncharacterized protein n=1 Tax=Dothidotthia symphoricarpi CBS 119687 TaxID=1392245 RepID=A0A6A6A7V5_9PLEO|nr:uncharacterized protein P153DRAFT_359096 [Dothidotthia symphoricarpi CBS 119687]KAF2126741.1 hypothetical protein P153DRAFT_359096 [Dothidotthia symphoricarpi CBS 119687]
MPTHQVGRERRRAERRARRGPSTLTQVSTPLASTVKIMLYLLVASLLTAAAIALPQGGEVGQLDECIENELAPGFFCENGEAIIDINQGYVSVGEAYDSDTINDAYDLNTAYGRYASSTNITFASSGDANVAQNDGYKAEFFVEGSKQHVGTLHKQRLYDNIYECLDQLCPVAQPECRNGFNFNGRSKCRINNILYRDPKTDKLATDGSLFVSIQSLHMDDEPEHADLKRAMFEMAAGMYAVMTEQYDNCYHFDAPGTRTSTFCNISPYVLVAFPTNTGVNIPYIAMTVEFDKKTIYHGLNCQAYAAPIAEFFDRACKRDFADAYGLWSTDITANVSSCWMTPACYRPSALGCYPFNDHN